MNNCPGKSDENKSILVERKAKHKTQSTQTRKEEDGGKKPLIENGWKN